LVLSLLPGLALGLLVPAQAAEAWSETPAVALEWNARLRHEIVEDDAFAPRAEATTLRLRATLRARIGAGFSALLEAEGVTNDGNRHDSTANGRTDYPVIADPEALELNQAWVGWQNAQSAATLGRQRVVLGNQRWVGNVGWRQNEQTFDALALEWHPAPDVTARYVWLDRAHRVNSDQALNPLARERALDTHLLDLRYKGGRHQLGGYAYLHTDENVPTASSATWGMRWSINTAGENQDWTLTLETAWQRDHAHNPLRFSHRYWLVESAYTRQGVTWRAGWEHLGGDGSHALQTPLATLHVFNGWADKFLVTPPKGLDDRYLAAGGKLGQGALAGKFGWTLAWHDLRANAGGARYGREWNASVGFPVHGAVSGLLKFADYRAQGFAQDTTKWWLQLEWTHP
jgi:hypothetical protein